MIAAAAIISLLLCATAIFFWTFGAGVGRRCALEEVLIVLREEAKARKERGQIREGWALEAGAFVVEELQGAPVGVWRGET